MVSLSFISATSSASDLDRKLSTRTLSSARVQRGASHQRTSEHQSSAVPHIRERQNIREDCLKQLGGGG